MHCPHCGHPDSRVTDSRDTFDGIRRRRECLHCETRFTTYERVQTAALLVVKRDGRREEFNREKLLTSVRKACTKRPLPTGAVEKLVDEIEGELVRLGKAEVPSKLIGEMVIERLRGLDRVAYIRFASVYKDFTDVEDFRQEVEALLQNRERELARPPANQLTLIPPEPLAVRRRVRRARGSLPSAASDQGA